MGAQRTGSGDQISLRFDFDTTAGNIVRFFMIYKMAESSQYSTVTSTVSCTDTELVPIKTSWAVPNQMRDNWWINTYFEYIITRPVKQNVEFVFNKPNVLWEWMGLCKYELESPTTWTVKQEVERQQRTNDALIRSLSA